jgi:hypothetical protein
MSSMLKSSRARAELEERRQERHNAQEAWQAAVAQANKYEAELASLKVCLPSINTDNRPKSIVTEEKSA